MIEAQSTPRSRNSGRWVRGHPPTHQGDVRCYVTPVPGVNLQNYLGRQVGVTGTRGYVIEQNASHIMARHVTPLQGAMLR